MTFEEIYNCYQELKRQLIIAASTMEKSEQLRNIKIQIDKLQEQCPHGNYKICPYCGKKLTME